MGNSPERIPRAAAIGSDEVPYKRTRSLSSQERLRDVWLELP
jgi:hypothetical protein